MIDITETAQKFFELSRKLNEDCENNIKELLNENGKKIEWDYEELDEYGLDEITMAYDGGNHPEYASNCFSTVKRVFLDDKGEIVIDVQDGRIWWQHHANAYEIYELWTFLEMLVNSRKENS